MSRLTRRSAVAIACALWVPARAAAPSPCAGPLPEAIAVPPGNAPAFEVRATGVQIYVCDLGGAAPTWTLKAPEATLTEPGGAPAGSHGAGPSWTAPDGSSVTGAKAGAATPDAGAIPWLLVRVTSHAGKGRFDEVTFIQRVATSGGLAPATGCDAAHGGATVRVAYTAAYCFHRAAR